MLIVLVVAGFDERDRSAPPVVYYSGAQGAEGFVLDQSSRNPRLKMDGSPEIFVLEAHPSTRGQVIMQEGNGGPSLRLSPLGGGTLYNGIAPSSGAPFGTERSAQPLRLAPRSRDQAMQLGDDLAAQLSARHGLNIAVDADWAQIPQTGPRPSVLADAIEIAGLALNRLAADPLARSAAAERLTTLRFEEGRSVGLALQADTLTVTIKPADGLEGRPSSFRIVGYLEGAL
ncbi:MAG: DUF4908 domain-containing protein [Pseudomonadota bacterium]